MKNQTGNWLFYLSAIPLLAIAFLFSQYVEQSDFYLLLACFIPFFVLYALVFQFAKAEKEINYLLGTAILIRVVLLFALPNLSDDFYRFIWDGRLTNLGINPFHFLPGELTGVEAVMAFENSSGTVFGFLNSPEYYSVYPPVNQLVFALSTFVFPLSHGGAVAVMKGVFLLAEIGTFWLIIKLCRHYRLPRKTVLLYALNPLIILETFNNLHFEIIVVFFLALALWCLAKGSWVWSAVAMGFAIGTKLLPLMFLPFLIKTLGWAKSIRYFLVTGLIILLLFSPVLNGFFVQNFSESVGLYFKKFEFNGSVYYMIRWLGYQFAGYNVIRIAGPLLGFLTIALVIWRVWKEPFHNTNRLPLNWLFAMTVFLFLSTTVHPWYLSSLIFLSLFTNYRFPLVWSGLILLTYINYSGTAYFENFWIVTLEYVFLILFIMYERNNQVEINANLS